MARPINETPVLNGKDAIRFLKNMKAAESTRVNIAERKRIKEAFSKIQSLAK